MHDRELNLFERPIEQMCYCVPGAIGACAPCRERREYPMYSYDPGTNIAVLADNTVAMDEAMTLTEAYRVKYATVEVWGAGGDGGGGSPGAQGGSSGAAPQDVIDKWLALKIEQQDRRARKRLRHAFMYGNSEYGWYGEP